MMTFARSIDPAGFNRIDVDVVLEKLHGHSLHHGIYGGFGSTVGDAPGIGNAGEDAGDEDYFPRLFVFHEMLANELAHVKGAEKSGIENRLEVFGLVVEKAFPAIESGDVDEAIDRAEFVEGGLKGVFRPFAGEGIRLDADTRHSEIPNRFHAAG